MCSQFVLLANEGLTYKEIALRLGQAPPKKERWRKRFSEDSLADIKKDTSRPERIKGLEKSKEKKDR